MLDQILGKDATREIPPTRDLRQLDSDHEESPPPDGAAAEEEAEERAAEEHYPEQPATSSAAFPKLSATALWNNAYINNPLPQAWCNFCGSGSHPLKDTNGNIACPQYQANPPAVAPALCRYQFCEDATSHMTPVCPSLVQLCAQCFRRGHSGSDGCETWTRLEWETRKDAFEEVAPEHVYASRRFDDDRYGFFGAKRGNRHPLPYNYAVLIHMDDIMAAFDIIDRYQRGEQIGGIKRRPHSHSKARKKARHD